MSNSGEDHLLVAVPADQVAHHPPQQRGLARPGVADDEQVRILTAPVELDGCQTVLVDADHGALTHAGTGEQRRQLQHRRQQTHRRDGQPRPCRRDRLRQLLRRGIHGQLRKADLCLPPAVD